MKFSDDGMRLASVNDRENVIKIWNLKNRGKICTLSGHFNIVLCVAFSDNG